MSILINNDVIILQNGYRGLGRSEHRCGVASNRLCEQTHEILLLPAKIKVHMVCCHLVTFIYKEYLPLLMVSPLLYLSNWAYLNLATPVMLLQNDDNIPYIDYWL